MAGQENCLRATRWAKKRAAEAMADSKSQQKQPATKKRVVLGELQNSSNGPATTDLILERRNPKCRSKKVKKAVANAATTITSTTQDMNVKSEDPQMCGAYISEIYQYLHDMEVSGSLLFLRLLSSIGNKFVCFGKIGNGLLLNIKKLLNLIVCFSS